jgi:hypothetical protein
MEEEKSFFDKKTKKVKKNADASSQGGTEEKVAQSELYSL